MENKFFALLFATLGHMVHGLQIASSEETCKSIGEFKAQSQARRISDTTWKWGCPGGSYVKAVASDQPNERFKWGKCCGDSVDNKFSWEIKDLSFFHKGKSSVNEKWNIECLKYSVITGFRFNAGDIGTNGQTVIFLSSVRCSILIEKVVDKQQCYVMDFSQPQPRDQDKGKPANHKTWQHECRKGYALAGLYDQTKFQTILKAKCCKLTEEKLRAGWHSNFTNNLAGFTQDHADDDDFILNTNGWLETNYIRRGALKKKFVLYRLMSPGISAGDFCLELTHRTMKGVYPFKLLKRDYLNDTLVAMVSGYEKFPNKTHIQQVFLTSTTRFQIVVELQLIYGKSIIKNITINDASQCKIDSCSVCTATNRVCKTIRGNLYCVSKPPVSTTSSAKGPSVIDGTTPGPTKNATIPKLTTTTTVPPDVASTKVKNGGSGMTLAIVSGMASGVLVIMIVLASCLCYKQHLTRKARHDDEFQHEVNELERSRTSFIRRQLNEYTNTHSISSNNIFRSYINTLGEVEQEPPAVFQETCIDSPPMNRRVPLIDPATGEPFYARIKKGLQNNERLQKINKEMQRQNNNNNDVEVRFENNNNNENIRHKLSSSMMGQTNVGYTTGEDEEDHNYKDLDDSATSRRASTYTLCKPDYGASDSEDEYHQGRLEFCIPGNDEEELLSNLHEIDPDNIVLTTTVLGQGAFGMVKLASLVSMKGTREVAVKFLKGGGNKVITLEDRVSFWQEAAIMSQFDHPNVIAFYGVVVGKRPTMIMEFLSRGNLWKYLNRIKRAREKRNIFTIGRPLQTFFLNLARDIACGMAYLSNLKFVHRDLAARNILIDSEFKCKIADFGLSRHFLKDEHYYFSKGGQIPVKWTAPEALQYKKYCTQSDVWSYAIVLWEIWSIGQKPYSNWNNDKVMKEVCENKYRLPPPKDIPKLISKLLQDCWNDDKHQRPTFQKIVFGLRPSDEQILGSQQPHHEPEPSTDPVDAENEEKQHF